METCSPRPILPGAAVSLQQGSSASGFYLLLPCGPVKLGLAETEEAKAQGGHPTTHASSSSPQGLMLSTTLQDTVLQRRPCSNTSALSPSVNSSCTCSTQGDTAPQAMLHCDTMLAATCLGTRLLQLHCNPRDFTCTPLHHNLTVNMQESAVPH